MTSHDAPEHSRIAPSGAGVVIRQETADDHREVREVHTRAFGDSERVPGLVEALRVAEAPLAPMSFVAVVDDRVVGHVLLSATRLDAPRRIVDVLSLWAGAVGFRSPSLRIPEAAFQVARLSAHEPWMTGTFVYSEVFWALDCVGLRDPGA